MEDAVAKVKWYQYINQSMADRPNRPQVRYVGTAQQTEKKSTGFQTRTVETTNKRLKGLEELVASLNTQLAKFGELMSDHATSQGRFHGRSPPPTRYGCFQCGGSGHFKRQCPHLSPRSLTKEHSPNRSVTFAHVPINGSESVSALSRGSYGEEC